MSEPPKLRPLCSPCVRDLREGGFRVRLPRTSYLYTAKCAWCGKVMPVHDAEVRGGKRRKPKAGGA